MAPAKHEPIAILGGGAWGLSSALHLVQNGYDNITVFDRAPDIPSVFSAGYDLNKIVRPEYEDSFYTDLALQAIEQWKTPLFGPHYHQTGYVVATSSNAPSKAVDHLQAALETIKTDPFFRPYITQLDEPSDIKKTFWQFTGPARFKGYINRHAGYAHSTNAMKAIYRHLSGRGVRFILGPRGGNVQHLVYNQTASSKRCTGVRTADGVTHDADLVISCLGAYQASIIPEIGSFAVAKSWSVAHIQLTEEECDLLRGIPVFNIRDLGFFFEPDPNTKLFKICPLGAGYINTDNNTGISLPPQGDLPSPQNFIPREDERKLRTLLKETLPWLANRPFVDLKMCWFADTADSDYCIDFLPGTANSVMVLTGDSGHGFKMMPIVGSWVIELLQKGSQSQSRWQWRQPTTRADSHDWGDAVSWRIGRTREIDEVVTESAGDARARL